MWGNDPRVLPVSGCGLDPTVPNRRLGAWSRRGPHAIDEITGPTKRQVPVPHRGSSWRTPPGAPSLKWLAISFDDRADIFNPADCAHVGTVAAQKMRHPNGRVVRSSIDALVIENDGVFRDCQRQDLPDCPWLADPETDAWCDFHSFRKVGSTRFRAPAFALLPWRTRRCLPDRCRTSVRTGGRRVPRVHTEVEGRSGWLAVLRTTA